MKRILLATTVILPFTASMAFANFLNVNQTISDSTQGATNKVETTINSENLTQDAANVANLVDQFLNGGNVNQNVSDLAQGASNEADTNGRWRRVFQDSANLSNILQGTGFRNVTQGAFDLEQEAYNSVTTGPGANSIQHDQISNIGQDATNVGNLVNTEANARDIGQSVGVSWSADSGAEQLADNVVDAGAGEGNVRRITQEAANLLNIVAMNNARNIHQSITGSTQDATNSIDQAGPGRFYDNKQDATNVGNLIDGNRITASASQSVSDLPQNATNYMNIAGGGEFVLADGDDFDVNTGDSPASALRQDATNLANIVQLAQLTVGLTQESSDSEQLASNAIARTSSSSGLIRLNDVTQTATNATNLVSAGNVGGGSTLVQSASNLGQIAENSITNVSSVGIGDQVIQGATNLGNVLTGND